MLWGLTIALAVGVLGLTAAFAMALGKVTGHADRHAERWAGWAVALAAVPRESSTGAPSPRASVATMRSPVSLNLPTSSAGVVDPGGDAQATGSNRLVVLAGLPPKPRGGAPARVAFCISFPEARSPR
jgi:hypothetical protein